MFIYIMRRTHAIMLVRDMCVSQLVRRTFAICDGYSSDNVNADHTEHKLAYILENVQAF